MNNAVSRKNGTSCGNVEKQVKIITFNSNQSEIIFVLAR